MPGITSQCVPQGQICTPRGQRALVIKLFWDVIGAKYYRPVCALGASVYRLGMKEYKLYTQKSFMVVVKASR
jgi:hypothetical protein